jgi:thermostable 8-oxoguanine DNA glycosylase
VRKTRKGFVHSCHHAPSDSDLTLCICTGFGEFTTQLQNQRVLRTHLLIPSAQPLANILNLPKLAIINVHNLDDHFIVPTRNYKRHSFDGIHTLLQMIPLSNVTECFLRDNVMIAAAAEL